MKAKETLTSEQSLEIITQMIETTKGNVKGSSFHLLLWGWVVFIGNVGHYLIGELTSYPHPYIIWLITLPAWIFSYWYGYKKRKEARVKTFTDLLIMWVWLCFLFGFILFVFSGKFEALIPALILILAGTCTFITGCIIKFKPLIYGGSTFWIFSAIALAVDHSYAPLISAIAIAVGYLVPGYMLKRS
ncbi:hypothetical protein [Maribacter sp. 2307ULW6-5]|uniref:hypothetical protein n=1 Tax=Maribacter sp. 2307ULW6-5 TaxID=3386275 RepID=UPI0039BD6FDE